MKSLKIILFIMIFLNVSGCASLTTKDISDIKNQNEFIFFYSLGDRLSVEYQGLTAFGNEYSEINISEWGIPSLLAKTVEKHLNAQTEHVDLFTITNSSHNYKDLAKYMRKRGVKYAFILVPSDPGGYTNTGATGLSIRSNWAQSGNKATILMLGFLGIIKQDGSYIPVGNKITSYIRIDIDKPKGSEYTIDDISIVKNEIQRLVTDALSERLSTIL